MSLLAVHFKCRGASCDRCCSGPNEGLVRLTPPDLKRLGSDIARVTLRRVSYSSDDRPRYVSSGGEFAMYRPPGGRCVFWSDGCSIYERRPQQCRDYPFWPRLTASREAWESEAARCPGIGEGPLVRLGRRRC